MVAIDPLDASTMTIKSFGDGPHPLEPMAARRTTATSGPSCFRPQLQLPPSGMVTMT